MKGSFVRTSCKDLLAKTMLPVNEDMNYSLKSLKGVVYGIM